ncbi:MAG: hypothetical protein AMJ70_01420 [Dehalococcoidia bacterium SG8_51_3]|nr:MAG: hypothetical protein AMJ70_01420 [Dehalococcoidia bacterium SG8_51_3]
MKVTQTLARAKQENRTVTTEIEVGQLLTQFGIKCVNAQLASTKERAVIMDARMILSAAKTPS